MNRGRFGLEGCAHFAPQLLGPAMQLNSPFHSESPPDVAHQREHQAQSSP